MSFLVVSLLMLNACLDIFPECMGGGNETSYTYNDFYSLKSSKPYSSFQERNMVDYASENGTGQETISEYLRDNYRYSADYAALLSGSLERVVFQHGLDQPASEDFWNQYRDHYFFDNRDYSGFDVLPTHSEQILTANVKDSVYYQADDVYLSNNLTRRTLLQAKGIEHIADSTLLSFKPEFYDSTKYYSYEIHVPRYRPNGDVVFILKRTSYLITEDSTGTEYFHNQFSVNHTVYLLERGEQARPLFQLSNDNFNAYRADLRVRADKIGVVYESGYEKYHFTLYNFQGEKLYDNVINKHVVIGKDGRSFTTNDGKYYRRLTDNKEIDLSSYYDNVTYAQPYENRVLVVQKDSTINFFDVEKQSTTYSVDLSQMPQVNTSPAKQNVLTIGYPLLAEDGSLYLLYMDNYYFDDPDDPCD